MVVRSGFSGSATRPRYRKRRRDAPGSTRIPPCGLSTKALGLDGYLPTSLQEEPFGVGHDIPERLPRGEILGGSARRRRSVTAGDLPPGKRAAASRALGP